MRMFADFVRLRRNFAYHFERRVGTSFRGFCLRIMVIGVRCRGNAFHTRRVKSLTFRRFASRLHPTYSNTWWQCHPFRGDFLSWFRYEERCFPLTFGSRGIDRDFCHLERIYLRLLDVMILILNVQRTILFIFTFVVETCCLTKTVNCRRFLFNESSLLLPLRVLYRFNNFLWQ